MARHNSLIRSAPADGVGIFQTDVISRSSIDHSQRVYCYVDNRWVTSAHAIYGTQYVNANQTAGVATNPVLSWAAIGDQLTPDDTVVGFSLYGRFNSAEVENMEYSVMFVAPVNQVAMSNGVGVDAVSEFTYTEVARGLFYFDQLPTAPTDQRRVDIPLNFSVPENGVLIIAFKPVGTFAATRYFYGSYRYEIETKARLPV